MTTVLFFLRFGLQVGFGALVAGRNTDNLKRCPPNEAKRNTTQHNVSPAARFDLKSSYRRNRKHPFITRSGKVLARLGFRYASSSSPVRVLIRINNQCAFISNQMQFYYCTQDVDRNQKIENIDVCVCQWILENLCQIVTLIKIASSYAGSLTLIM